MLQSGKGVERKNPEEAADLMLTALDHGNAFSRLRMTKYSSAWSKEFRQALQRRLRRISTLDNRLAQRLRQSRALRACAARLPADAPARARDNALHKPTASAHHWPTGNCVGKICSGVPNLPVDTL